MYIYPPPESIPCHVMHLLRLSMSLPFIFTWLVIYGYIGALGESPSYPTCKSVPPEFGLISAVPSSTFCNQSMTPPFKTKPVYPGDKDLLQFALNLEYLEAEFFLFGALGHGLDIVAPELVMGGPPPIGARQAKLDNVTQAIIEEFGYQEVGHLRAIKSMVDGFARPLLNLSAGNFATLFDTAVGYKLKPPFDPYGNTVNYLLASYVIPYVGLVGYVGANRNLYGYVSKRLVAGLLGVESGQDAVIRTLLYQRSGEIVMPYKLTVAEFTTKISNLRNQLAMCGIRDEGIIVAPQLGAENRTCSNILSADANSISYDRTPAQILRIVYSTGNEKIPGGFFPAGANGKIARDLHQ